MKYEVGQFCRFNLSEDGYSGELQSGATCRIIDVRPRLPYPYLLRDIDGHEDWAYEAKLTPVISPEEVVLLELAF